MEHLRNLKDQAKSAKKANKRALEKLKKLPKREVDDLIHSLHEQAFQNIDCLDCANCCKTTGPLLTDKDVVRISKQLNKKPQDFIEEFLRVDEDGDFIFQSLPCPFLDQDNFCSIYSVRPKACREYPHTDRPRQQQILKLTLKNTEVCPAVYQIVEQIKAHI